MGACLIRASSVIVATSGGSWKVSSHWEGREAGCGLRKVTWFNR